MTATTANFIDDDLICEMLEEAKGAGREEVTGIIRKAEDGTGLTLREAAVLLQSDHDEVISSIYSAANQIKENIYGRRLVFFAPLYISNYCVNNCIYCGYRRDNKFVRQKLTMEQIKEEVRVLEDMGHKRLALECGEDPQNCSMDYILESIEAIYSVKEKKGTIRRINVNVAATTVENYRRLKEKNIGTYILFQETYHRPTYAWAHPSGPKSDYDWHTCAMDRAMQGGIDDVGIGVLYGLYDYKYEVLATLLHARHLEKEFGAGPHTISVPRLRPAEGVDLDSFPYLVSDADFKKIIAVLRLAVPYTGIILSTRERPEFRDELLSVGVSQLSAGSCTGVGGYQKEKTGECKGENVPQFSVEDARTLDEVVKSISKSGYIPSFCTACYRAGRTGDRFMALAKSGKIQDVCHPNALLTFQEFLNDYASPETRLAGEETIREHLNMINNASVRRKTEEKLDRIDLGDRDLFF